MIKKDLNERKRQEHELPLCIEDWGWKYHHLGVPTKEKFPDEKYLPLFLTLLLKLKIWTMNWQIVTSM